MKKIEQTAKVVKNSLGEHFAKPTTIGYSCGHLYKLTFFLMSLIMKIIASNHTCLNKLKRIF